MLASIICGMAISSTACVSPGTPVHGISSPSAGSGSPRTAQFGQRYAWADGVSVELSRPKPLSSPLISPGRRGVQLTMTLSNGGSETLRLPMTRLDGTYSERGTGRILQAEPVVDKLGNIGISPDAPELPAGRSIEVRIGFAVGEQAGTLLVAASPDMGVKYQDVTFAGEV